MNLHHPKCQRCDKREALFHIALERSCAECLTEWEKREMEYARAETLLAPRDLVEPFGGNI